jgi:hypothetical protein
MMHKIMHGDCAPEPGQWPARAKAREQMKRNSVDPLVLDRTMATGNFFFVRVANE